MDRWNNDVGIRAYDEWKDAFDKGQTEFSLEKWLYDKVKQGETINNPDICEVIEHVMVHKFSPKHSGLKKFFLPPIHAVKLGSEKGQSQLCYSSTA
jgi:hypothetical protein